VHDVARCGDEAETDAISGLTDDDTVMRTNG